MRVKAIEVGCEDCGKSGQYTSLDKAAHAGWSDIQPIPSRNQTNLEYGGICPECDEDE